MLVRLTNITGVSEEVDDSMIYVGRQEKCNTASIQNHMHTFCLCVSVCTEGGLKKCWLLIRGGEIIRSGVQMCCL